MTTHINENLREVAEVTRVCDAAHYLEAYDRHGLVGPRTVLAHNVHPTDDELKLLGARDAVVAHCPTSNCALGSGLFPLKRHVEAGVRVALGSDIGAGTGFSLFKEGLQAYFLQQLLGGQGLALQPAHLLHLATVAGADALGLADVGDLSVGKRFDAIWLHPRPSTTLDVVLRNADGADDALAKAFALASPADVERVWVEGEELNRSGG
jgi:guanine deaminase